MSGGQDSANSTGGLKFSGEVTKQIVTLSTGIIALTVTFAKEFKVIGEGSALTVPGSLKLSWVSFAVSILFAIWTLLAIAGTLNEIDRGGETTNPKRTNIRIPAALMVLAFFVGIISTIWAGWKIVG